MSPFSLASPSISRLKLLKTDLNFVSECVSVSDGQYLPLLSRVQAILRDESKVLKLLCKYNNLKGCSSETYMCFSTQNPRHEDIKLGQMQLLLEKAHKLSQEWGTVTVVLAGDFNSMPQLDIQLHYRRRISGWIKNGSHFRTFHHNENYAGHIEHLVPLRVLETLPITILRRKQGLPSKAYQHFVIFKLALLG
ncbi:hypothetical protein RJ641_014846 [Dillenia turbinata]|uniref:Endonuclease/exonuclease/phosphatase domain-containing protein n=1 Tax=Dillenia turbinata TaxID=194707 RepID=A0AAN8Z5A9_9MAGN